MRFVPKISKSTDDSFHVIDYNRNTKEENQLKKRISLFGKVCLFESYGVWRFVGQNNYFGTNGEGFTSRFEAAEGFRKAAGLPLVKPKT